MASTVEEYREAMTAEVLVEMAKLRDMAQHGVPAEVRGDVWKYLLDVAHPDKTGDLTLSKAKAEEYRSCEKESVDINVMKRLKGEIKRYHPEDEFFRDSDHQALLYRVVGAYLNRHRTVEYFPALVHMCGPFAFSLKEESDVFFCFEQLATMMEDHFSQQNLQEKMSKFILFFRAILGDLYNYFEEEEVAATEWATPWMKHLLAKELPLECVLRLWDTYFSTPNGIDLHIYVCLAILKHFKDTLDDLEHSEIIGFLSRLPKVDMDQIIAEAYNLKEDILSQGLL